MSQTKIYSPQKLATLQAWVNNRVKQKQSFAIRGTNSRLSPTETDIVSTRNLKDVLFFDPDDMVVGVQAGMTAAELQALINEKEMFLPINPWYPKSTIGSVVACNDFGPNRMNGGGLRDSIIGIEYINGRGELVRAGGKVVKNVSGYDLGKMMLGSQGGLGVITSVNFKIIPQPPESFVLYSAFDNDQWMEKVRLLHEKMILVDWIEVITTETGWILGIGFSGNKARRTRIEKELRNIFSENLQHPLEVLPESQKPKSFSPYPGQNRLSGFLHPLVRQYKPNSHALHLHVVIPTGELLTQLNFQELKEQGAHSIVHPIGGDFHLIVNDKNLEAQQNLVSLLKKQLNGTEGKIILIKSNQGIAIKDLNDFAIPTAYPLMKAIKQQLDPANIFHAPFYEY